MAAVTAAAAAAGLLTGSMLLAYAAGASHAAGSAAVVPAGVRTGSVHAVEDEGAGGTVVGVPFAPAARSGGGPSGLQGVIAAS
ncbi:hypothetical protein ABZZ17_19275 [Streptomyces sp. NPDC006512]|uniref:hypothetical protein n=1 Tax=Streptomyces sp. NPDC006512 TaxID=3154307 RepID=UPI0033A29031